MFTLCMSRGSPPLTDNCEKSHGNKKKQIKGGYLLRYRRGLFCKGWCEEWVILYEDSTLAWYTDKTLCRPKGFVRISDAPELVAVGEWTKQVPRRPKLPRPCHIGQLLAIGCRRMHDVYWLMGQTPTEVNDWMRAISNTLPPPPSLSFDDQFIKLSHQHPIANGHAKPVANGSATMIPNGRCQTGLPSKPSENSTYVIPSVASTYRPIGARKPDKFDNDHTVLAGVCLDWGHGWGWTNQTSAVAPQISLTVADTVSSSVYCHSADYSMAGYDDVDWSAFGDFCF